MRQKSPADIPNYTNTQPTILNQPSETVLEQQPRRPKLAVRPTSGCNFVTEQRSAGILLPRGERCRPTCLSPRWRRYPRPIQGWLSLDSNQTSDWVQEIPNGFPQNVGAPTLKVILEGFPILKSHPNHCFSATLPLHFFTTLSRRHCDASSPVVFNLVLYVRPACPEAFPIPLPSDRADISCLPAKRKPSS